MQQGYQPPLAPLESSVSESRAFLFSLRFQLQVEGLPEAVDSMLPVEACWLQLNPLSRLSPSRQELLGKPSLEVLLRGELGV